MDQIGFEILNRKLLSSFYINVSMPYSIVIGVNRYSVIDSKTGKIHSHHATLEGAENRASRLNEGQRGGVRRRRLMER